MLIPWFSRGGHKDHADFLDTEGPGSCFFPCTSVRWHWPQLHIKHPAFIKREREKKETRIHLRSAAPLVQLPLWVLLSARRRTLLTSQEERGKKKKEMAKSERQRRSLKSEELLFDSEASLLDQQDFEISSCSFSDVFNSKDSHMEQINTFLKNVQVLLEAARFLESAERKDGSEFCLCCVLILFVFIRISEGGNDNKTTY